MVKRAGEETDFGEMAKRGPCHLMSRELSGASRLLSGVLRDTPACLAGCMGVPSALVLLYELAIQIVSLEPFSRPSSTREITSMY